MPINPNIALGIQPIQQPNMLAQYAQVMGIKAAQQEMEGSQEARDYFSRPVSERGDPSRLLGTKQGQAAYKALNEGQVKQLEAEQKRISLVGAGAGAVLENPTMETFTSVVSNLVDRGIYTPQQRDQAFAAIGNDPSKIKAFVTPIFNQAISAEKRLSDITSRRGQNITAGTAMRGQDISARTAAERLAFEKQKGKTIAGEGQFFREDVYGNLFPVQGFGAQFGPDAPPPVAPPMPPAAANAFVTAARPSVNAFVPTAQPQGAGPTVAAAAAMDAQNNVPRPKVPIRQPVAIIGPDGKSVLVPPEQAVGKQPATAFAESTAEKKAQLNRDIATAIRNLELVVKPGGLLEKSTGSGLGRLYDASKGFFGGSTEGAIAGAQLAPIADMILKMVPRFEGPQSNKDVDSYLAAAGKLADTGLPNDIRKGAAEVILKLMKERKGQFEIKGQEGGGGGGAAPKTVTRTGTLDGRKVVEYSDGTTAYAD
jgi:hypothetical protein